MLKTEFWKHAADSLPAQVRARYLPDLEQVERWELAIDGAIEVWARLKDSFAKAFQTPRGAH